MRDCKLLAITLLGFAVMSFGNCPAIAEENGCPVPNGLYEQREALEADFFKAWGNGINRSSSEMAAAEESRAKEQTIDQRYFLFMSTLTKFQSARRERLKELEKYPALGSSLPGLQGAPEQVGIDRCCPANTKDPIVAQFCELTSYLADDRKDKDRFIEKFPHSTAKIKALWALDKIWSTNSGQPGSVETALFNPEDPTTAMIRELSSVADTGQPLAIARLVKLFEASDGVYAEQTGDALCSVKASAPEAWQKTPMSTKTRSSLKEWCSEN